MTPITGYHAIEAALERGGAGGVLLVGRSSARIERLAGLAAKRGIAVKRVALGDLDRHAPRDEHRGAVLLASEGPRPASSLREVAERGGEQSLVLLMDAVTDPRNLGAIVRSADLFGVDAIVTTHRRSAHETQAVRTTSAGAVEWVPIVSVSNLAQAISTLKQAGYWIYGAEAGGDDPASVDLRGRVALAVGAEGGGLHRLVRESCDRLLGIPASGHVDSFNVSVAAAILMYEVRRQQRVPAGPAGGKARGGGPPRDAG
jgi:23S rRNA (guanosine2251-2'-O)-methyltransferase